MPEQLDQQYERLKAISVESLGAVSVANLIADMAVNARHMLRRVERLTLTSATGKNYFSFRDSEQSRPINTALYVDAQREYSRLISAFRDGLQQSDGDTITRATYSIAYSVFAAHDVNRVGRKASATFFEILIGHIVARTLGVAP